VDNPNITDFTIASRISDPESELAEKVVRLGPGFLIVRNNGANRTHILRTEDTDARVFIGERFRFIGWVVRLPAVMECGAKLQGRGAWVMRADQRVTCPVCAHVLGGWL
jgi:hypothetical protein